MPRTFDAQTAELVVFTFKDGVLSAVAHDLMLRAGRWQARFDEATGKVEGRIETASLEVVFAVKGGQPAPTLLSAKDRADIRRNLEKDVLHPARFPEVRFEGQREGPLVRGQLTLHGVTRELSLSLRAEPGRQVVEVSLDQRDFGITPFRALMGALKVRPEVKIQISLPEAPAQ